MRVPNNLLRIVIFCFLTLAFVYADLKNDVDAGETLTDDRIPLVPNYDEISGDQLEANSRNHGHVRFENETPGLPVKFVDTPDDNLDDLSAINVSNEHNLIITVDENIDDEDNNHKVRFEESRDSEREHSDSDETIDDIQSENDTGQVVFDVTKSSDSKSNLDDIEYENEDTRKLSDNQDLIKSVQNNVESERVVFEDNQKVKEPIQYKKRPIRRKPRVQFKVGVTQMPNAAYSGFKNPKYPGVNAGYSNPEYASTYPGYPNRYPPPGSPGGYLDYTNQSPYPTQPNYPAYQPVHEPGYGLYPGHQAQQMPHPQGNLGPSKYPAEKYPTSSPARPVAYPEQEYTGAGYPIYPSQGGYPGYPSPNGPSGNGGYGFNDGNPQYGQYGPRPDYPEAPRPGPSRRPKSLPERAVSAVAEALTSIALFDDKQCVPRLLCEVASGSTSTSPTLLKATAGLAPLLTVLQAYNGVSTSPLFLFGRAAVLGMTSKGNPTSCRYAYSQCPNSPDALLDYLNNHNGGFFRFFGQPEGNKQQNLEQFYNHLAGQYGNLQKPQAQVNQHQSYAQQRPFQKPGYIKQQQSSYPQQQQPGYPQQHLGYAQLQPGYPQQQSGYPQQQPTYPQHQPGYRPEQSYQQQQANPQSIYPQQQGYPPQQSYPHNPYSYGYGSQSPLPQNYGPNYLYAYRNAIEADSDTEASFTNTEERIQNKPGVQAIEEEEEKNGESGSKWAFPDEANTNKKENKQNQRKQKAIRSEPQRPIRDERGGSKLKFPDEKGLSENYFDVNRENNFIWEQKGILSPSQHYFNVQASYQTAPGVNSEEYEFDHKHNFYVKRPEPVNDNADLVYVVRGNGDPNHPEVIQVRPGQNTY